MKKIIHSLLLFVFVICLSECSNRSKPRNIILFISDGCGYNHLLATDYFQYGKKGAQAYEKFPFSAFMSTYPYGGSYATEKVWIDFEYLKDKYSDSAAAATAMSTGVKTRNGMIGVSPDSVELKNVVEIAEEQGKSTGVISSVQFAHATPAGFVAHNAKRSNYKEIASEMIVESRMEVIMGCGHPWYDHNGKKILPDKVRGAEYKYVGGEQVWDDLLQGTIGNDCDYDGEIEYWTLVQRKKDFQNLSRGETPERILGIPQVGNTLQYDREGREESAFQVPFNSGVPSLADMTRAGLNVLDNNKNGFFLMIEGGAVDWASHDNNSARMIEEQIDLNQSVEAAVEWVKKNSSWDETLIIVTADHECGYLQGPGSGGKRKKGESIEKVWKPLVLRGKGILPEMEWYHGSHSNTPVPIFARGTGWKVLQEKADEIDTRFGLYLDNAELGRFLKEMVI